MIIRRETPEEFPEIYNLVKTAFQTAKVTNGKEQDFVNQLRSGINYIPELALVAEEKGRLIGHIMLTKIYIVGDPAYYHRFGFKPSVSFGIKNANNIPNEYVLGCELVEGVLKRINGSIDFSNL